MSKWDGYRGFDEEKWDAMYGKGKYAPDNRHQKILRYLGLALLALALILALA